MPKPTQPLTDGMKPTPEQWEQRSADKARQLDFGVDIDKLSGGKLNLRAGMRQDEVMPKERFGL